MTADNRGALEEDFSKPHVYRQWVDSEDVGNTCCLEPRVGPMHIPDEVAYVDCAVIVDVSEDAQIAFAMRVRTLVALWRASAIADRPTTYREAGQELYDVCFADLSQYRDQASDEDAQRELEGNRSYSEHERAAGREPPNDQFHLLLNDGSTVCNHGPDHHCPSPREG